MSESESELTERRNLFTRQLQDVYQRAGGLPYRDIAARTGGQCSASTVCRILTAGQTFARWENVESVLVVLAKLGGLAGLGEASSMTWWSGRYFEARHGAWNADVAAVADPGLFPSATDEAGARPAGAECLDCGAWVTNPRRHNAWHAGFGQPVRPSPGNRANSRRRPTYGAEVAGLSDPTTGRIQSLPAPRDLGETLVTLPAITRP